MSEVAVVDLGTITTRLLLVDGDGRRERHQPVTRMGAGMEADGRIGDEALSRVEATLTQHLARLDAAEPDRVRAVATSAARDASNRDDLMALVKGVLGLELDVLSGEEEGRLAFVGAMHGVGDRLASDQPVVVLDIGGGSTEVSLGSRSAGLLGVHSADIGASRVTEAYLASDPPLPEELSAALSVIRLHLDDARREVTGLTEALRDGRVIGLGGTITTAAAVELGLATYDPDQIDQFVLRRAAAEDVFRTVATEASADRAHNPGLPAERVDLIVGGSAILVEFMRHLGIDEITVSEHDLLDGVAAALVCD